MTKQLSRPRGRPRQFDPELAIATAQGLFHARGYDDVSVADLTDAFGIKAPSFYAAFGSKAGLYARVIQHYGIHGAVPLPDLLRADRSVAQSIAAMLEDAARRYASDPAARGCIVLEGCSCSDQQARTSARAAHAAAEQVISDYIAARHPKQAAALTQYLSTVMLGLSAKARLGESAKGLLSSARLASFAVAQALSDTPDSADGAPDVTGARQRSR